ncbi:MAG: DUF1549 domain-containing protein, partial [Planctomycetes bacterium]|nr:DUF1549 domain-containing protein [Planctomycetota bacterium]
MAGRPFKPLLSFGSVLMVLLSVLSLGMDVGAKEKKPQAGGETTISPEDLKFFNSKILPVLAHRCYKCHSHKSKELEAGLYLDSRAGWAKGGDNGPAIIPGNPKKSRLIKALHYDVKGIEGMPEDGKLKPEVVKDFEEWVRRGAPDPRKGFNSDIDKSLWKEEFKKRRAKHWAWQPLAAKDPGPVKDKAWARTKIDRYLLARLEAKGLKPAKPADKNTLIRRVTFDVIGLPPTPEELDAFLKDDSPQAFEKVVDRLLASPRFGERWARHWMDLVRYAETYGHEFDYPIHHPHLYRDYLIRALNSDVSYKQFVIEAIAGDLVDPPRLHPKERFNESVIGTGFWYLGEEVHSPVDILQDESDRVDNQIDVMTRTFLGLTVGCARCHNHKFDAISASDYYALKGFLQSSSQQHAEIDSPMEFRKARDQILALDRQRKDKVLKMFATQQQRGFAPLSKYLLSAREILLPAESKPISVQDAAKKF